ncbi:MAG: hypothetical protein ABW116_08535 [Candidatus Sedimenticola sp. 20ELBAFRAG]
MNEKLKKKNPLGFLEFIGMTPKIRKFCIGALSRWQLLMICFSAYLLWRDSRVDVCPSTLASEMLGSGQSGRSRRAQRTFMRWPMRHK